MIVLLDTHAFVWAVLDTPQVSKKCRELWLRDDVTLLLSPAVYWEISIKVGIGKLELPETDLASFFNRQIILNQLEVLPISPEHAALVAELPLHHRDPFDRMLVAQALTEEIPLLSIDKLMDPYGVERLW